MIEIVLRNPTTKETFIRKFDDEFEADKFENLLGFMGLEYEFWLNGERLY